MQMVCLGTPILREALLLFGLLQTNLRIEKKKGRKREKKRREERNANICNRNHEDSCEYIILYNHPCFVFLSRLFSFFPMIAFFTY